MLLLLSILLPLVTAADCYATPSSGNMYWEYRVTRVSDGLTAVGACVTPRSEKIAEEFLRRSPDEITRGLINRISE